MNNWPSDPSSIPNNNHAGFAPSADHSMSFLAQNQTIDPSQFQQPPRFLDGLPRNPSPAFQNPFPPVNPVVPLKRPREESIGTSPRQPPGSLPGQRAHTPSQGPFPGYVSGPNGTPNFQNGPTMFSHLQAGAPQNSTPSPTPNNLSFPQHPSNQRVSTASPSPFSPHHPGQGMSPALSDHTSRVGTPHENPNGYIQQPSFAQNFTQGQFIQGVPAMNQAGGGNPQMNMPQQQMQQAMQHPNAQNANAQQQQQQRAYQMQMHARQLQAQAASVQAAQAQAQAAQAVQGRPPSSGMVQMGNPNMPVQTPPMNSGQNLRGQPSPEAFMRGIQAFMGAKGATVNVNPVICGRPLPLMQLFYYISRNGGSGRISKTNQWLHVAQHFQFPATHLAMAASEIREYWARNIVPYEQAWVAKHKGQPPPTRAPSTEFDGRPSQQIQTPGKQPGPGPGFGSSMNDVEGSKVNGATPQNIMNGFTSPQLKDSPQTPHHKAGTRQPESNHTNGVMMDFPPTKRVDRGQHKGAERDTGMPRKQVIPEVFEPEVLPGDESRMHGPICVDEMMMISGNLVETKPVVPTFRELGVVDIHALNMSIKSGIVGEVRLALDTLVTLSLEPSIHLALEACDDLVESLIDCALEQVDVLAKHATEVSDEMLIAPYEDVLRGCKVEVESLQDVPEMGSTAYDLDRAADRLICITTLMRNFSFYETNFALLGTPEVVRLLTSVIKYLGTKEMFLRSHQNTLDFMKDVVIFLSNLSHSIQLPGKEEALCLLHFLLSFAPCLPATSTSSTSVSFPNYNPNVHKYTPSAVDSLAKLLARDDPNRTYYRSIFAADSAFTSPHDLLTRAFGLAIAPIPTNARGSIQTLIEARKPFLLQGMLAAEILCSLVPSSDSDLALSWLRSTDGFAATLLKLVWVLAAMSKPPPPPSSRHGSQRGAHAEQDDAINAITRRGIAILHRLAEKSRSAGGEIGEARLPASLIPRQESMLGALVSKDVDPYVVRQLCLYSGLEE